MMFSTLFASSGTSIGSVEKSWKIAEANLLAQSKLDEIGAAREPLPAYARGAFADADMQWQIAARDVRRVSPRPGLRLQDVRLVVRWRMADGPQSITFITRHLGVAL